MKTYWIDNSKEEKVYETLQQDTETDICIIGGGLTGITTAYYLNKYKIKNVVLEKGKICQKASGHSTAKITSQHGLFYKYLIDSEGEEFARKYYEANQKAISEIKRIIIEENIECELEDKSAYVFTQSIQDVQKIKDEVEAVKKIGGKANLLEGADIEINKISRKNDNIELFKNEMGVESIENQKLKKILPIKALAEIEFPNQAQFNPYKYATSLAKICDIRGTKIYENSKAVEVHPLNRGYEITLENGCKVKAKYIVLATKYPFIDFPGYHFLKMYQVTSNVIVVEPKEEADFGMYINSEEPAISLRTIKNGEKRLVMVAGFNHKTGAKIDLSNSYYYLEKVARSLYPNCEVKYKWNTEDAIPLDKIPYIGEFSKEMPRVYVATGYKKWGITTSNIAAKIIVDKIMERENEYGELFRATRLEPIKNIKELGNMIKESVNSLVINKLKSPKETIEQVGNDEGKIVEIDGEKVGVYKDKEGKIFKIKPVCQHLGCELSWNNLDKTWDCPCHGSRYDYKGNLIYGPSVKNLETILDKEDKNSEE